MGVTSGAGTVYPSSAPKFTSRFLSGVRSLVLYVCFADRCLSFFPFSFVHCVVCPSSIYGFLLPLWYLQTFLYTPTLIWSVPNTKVDPKELRVWQVSLCYFYPLGYNKLQLNNYIFRFSFHDNKTRNSYTIWQFPLDNGNR